MNTHRTHYVTTSDGVAIGATVHGQGPPLVLLHGAFGDSDLDWNRVVEYLTDQFACHLLSLRGRGLSGDHPDLSPGRLVDDLVTYVDSLEQPTGLAGYSGGSNVALAAAAQCEAVHAVAAFEPGIPSQIDEQLQAVAGEAVAHMAELATEGNLTAAARAFADYPFTDNDIAMAEATGYFEATGRYMPNLLNLLQQFAEHADPADDPAVLGAISAPVLMLHGSDTKPFFTRGVRYVAEHVPDATVREIPGAGHAVPVTHPEALAEALTEFFSVAQQPA